MVYFKTIQIIKLGRFPKVVSENRTAKGLQKARFRLNSRPMNFRNRFVTLLCAAALAFSLVGVAAATEQQRLDEPSLFERYTNSAQDLILKGLELVGINYRRGGTNPDQLVFWWCLVIVVFIVEIWLVVV